MTQYVVGWTGKGYYAHIIGNHFITPQENIRDGLLMLSLYIYITTDGLVL
jgi:hypothetical protein